VKLQPESVIGTPATGSVRVSISLLIVGFDRLVCGHETDREEAGRPQNSGRPETTSSKKWAAPCANSGSGLCRGRRLELLEELEARDEGVATKAFPE
jgi:hypothetical protein